MNLPFDLKVLIFSYLSENEIRSFTFYLPKKLINYTMIHKFPNINKEKINGIVNNFHNKCYKCNNNLGFEYNIILCYRCSEKLDTNINYPIICHICAKNKLNRGQVRFTSCDICGGSTMHLGITPYS
jgi:hypothetical protein